MMTLPHSEAAEQTLLGMCLLDNGNYDVVSERLQPDDFFIPLYSQVFKAIGDMRKEGIEANPITLPERLDGERVELFQHFADMFAKAAMVTDIGSIAYTVSQLSYQRKLITLAGRLTEAANANKVDDAKTLQGDISELTQTFVNMNPETPLMQAQKAFKEACSGEAMMKTGLEYWDDLFGGLFKGSRYIIAGHGGAGKSALAINIAWNMAKAGRKVRWLSYEEEPHALWWRIYARECRVPIAAFRHGLDVRQQIQVTEHSGEFGKYDFLAFYGLPDVGSMIGACGQCDLIVLDGITSAPAPGAETKVDKAGIVTEYCAKMAAKTGATVIMLGHVNSDSLKTGASMSGIYGGQAATFDPEGIVDLRWADDSKTTCTMSVLKNRYGGAGLKKALAFDGNFQTFRGDIFHG